MADIILLLHGWQGSPAGHWQDILAKKSQQFGSKQRVLFPQFSDADFPKLEVWLEELDQLIQQNNKTENRFIIVTHSLGGVLLLQYLKEHPEFQPYQVLLVSSLLDDCGFKEISNFFPLPQPSKLQEDTSQFTLVYSDNDPYIPIEKYQKLIEMFHFKEKLLPNQGHINIASGYGEWPWIEKELGIG